MGKLLCFFGFHRWEEDPHKVNGFLNRFCDRCSARQIRTEPDKRWVYW